MIKEFCAENFTKIPQAIQKGANRIELCDNLAVGGTTPSTGVIEEVLAYAGEHSVPVMTIIRPRGGNFVYNDIELKNYAYRFNRSKEIRNRRHCYWLFN